MKKKYSLKSKTLFNKVLNKGIKIKSKYFFISYKQSNNFLLGISIPKKLGNAVFRNYHKRVIKNIIPNIKNIYKIKAHIVLIFKEPFANLPMDLKIKILNEEFKKINNE
ncbi:MAG: ribonuclease P protein component [Mycoplasmataceae bacterium]|nr:ribonuclease P protein component [Mycoplasmataceae bacterium]